ncbi:MAG TPA: M48 family metalloprotease, partial [Alloacidobacterium sp.]|nr:M48 family metalloprotease [Alloacidobacterium sp.]
MTQIVKKKFLPAVAFFLVVNGLAIPAHARFAQPAPCKNSFTQEKEIAEGKKAEAQVYKEMPVLPDSSAITQYVQKLGAKLVQFAPGYQWPYSFHVVNQADINAFALPGGPIFVNLGTIQAAETEAQLAGVMAHEISHVVMRHATCNITKQHGQAPWWALGQLAAGVLLPGAGGALAAQGVGAAAGMTFLKMGRDAEKQADLMGTDIAYDAGYDPRGMVQ